MGPRLFWLMCCICPPSAFWRIQHSRSVGFILWLRTGGIWACWCAKMFHGGIGREAAWFGASSRGEEDWRGRGAQAQASLYLPTFASNAGAAGEMEIGIETETRQKLPAPHQLLLVPIGRPRPRACPKTRNLCLYSLIQGR